MFRERLRVAFDARDLVRSPTSQDWQAHGIDAGDTDHAISVPKPLTRIEGRQGQPLERWTKSRGPNDRSDPAFAKGPIQRLMRWQFGINRPVRISNQRLQSIRLHPAIHIVEKAVHLQIGARDKSR